MAVHVGTSSAAPSLRPVRIRRPRPRLVLTVLVLAVLAFAATMPGEVASAAHAACTLGSPEHVTCGEALVLLGYP